MRITNDAYSPIELLAELVALPGVKSADTARFTETDYDNHDWLVRRWSEKLEIILRCFRRYGVYSAKTQCVRDHGVDVYLSFNDAHSGHRHIGFQIKSNREAAAERAKTRGAESMVGALKRQAFEAGRHWNAFEWWVIPCFSSPTYSRLVSSINAELMSGNAAQPKIRVISPEQALTFIDMEDDDIDALCARFLCADDEVLKAATNELNGLSPEARAFVLSTFGRALEGDRRQSQEHLVSFDLADGAADCAAAVVDTVDRLEACGFLKTRDSGDFHIEPAAFPGVCALYFEARVRHDCSPDGASGFVRTMTQPLVVRRRPYRKRKE